MAARYASGFDDALASQVSVPGMAPPLWQYGHLAVSAEGAFKLLGGQPFLPPLYTERFAMGTRFDPALEYPPFAEVLAAFADAQTRLVPAIESATDSALDSEMPIERLRGIFPTIRLAVVFLTGSHVSYHLGLVMACRKAVGLGVPSK
jgi:hypothetical protein